MTPPEESVSLIGKKLWERTNALEALLYQAAVAEVDFKVAMAKAKYQATASTVSEREAEALLACEEAYRAYKLAEATADACREAVRSLRDQLSGAQSLLRAEMESAKL